MGNKEIRVKREKRSKALVAKEKAAKARKTREVKGKEQRFKHEKRSKEKKHKGAVRREKATKARFARARKARKEKADKLRVERGKKRKKTRDAKAERYKKKFEKRKKKRHELGVKGHKRRAAAMEKRSKAVKARAKRISQENDKKSKHRKKIEKGKKAAKRKEHKLKAKKLKKLKHKNSCSIHPGLYSIKTTGVHAGASARQPAGWGLSAWQKHGARRNGASSWSAVHAGTYWPMIWNIQPSKRTRGTYTIKTTKYGPKGGSQPAGWGLSAWNAHGARRNSASSRVAVHAGNFWLMDWYICPSKRTKGAYTIKTSGVHSKDSAKQPAGWGLAAWQLHGGRRNSASSWVYVHAGNKWLMDWQLGP